MAVKAAPGWDKMPVYNHDLQQGKFPAEVTAWADAIRAADGVIIVSPEYNWSIPGGLKNAIDWVSRFKEVPFKEKPVALQSCAGGVLGGARMQYHLRQCLTSIDALIFGKPEIFVYLLGEEIRREDAGADRSADHRHRQAATRRLREIHPPRERRGISPWHGSTAAWRMLTGGAKGIGRHYAKELAAEGARLMIADIADGKELAEEIAASTAPIRWRAPWPM